MDIQIVKFSVNTNIALQVVENSNKVLLIFRSPVKAHKFFIPYVLKYSHLSSPCPSRLGFRNFFKITDSSYLGQMDFSHLIFVSFPPPPIVYHEWL